MFNHQSLIPWDHFEVHRRKVGIISGSGSFRGRFGDHFRVGDHFGVGIISGAVQGPLLLLSIYIVFLANPVRLSLVLRSCAAVIRVAT